ncbi:unnamed protein product [Oikopleura dioica]|uniref:Uncharacterized protein n=2 Tax=Oikopleura dioica TaxID=34765 RepID=E4YHF2_OIKDI|nr:unnamed protein product [Oikopleura dioica]
MRRAVTRSQTQRGLTVGQRAVRGMINSSSSSSGLAEDGELHDPAVAREFHAPQPQANPPPVAVQPQLEDHEIVDFADLRWPLNDENDGDLLYRRRRGRRRRRGARNEAPVVENAPPTPPAETAAPAVNVAPVVAPFEAQVPPAVVDWNRIDHRVGTNTPSPQTPPAGGVVDWNRIGFAWPEPNNARSREVTPPAQPPPAQVEEISSEEYTGPPGYVPDDPPSSDGSGYGTYYRTVTRIVAVPDSPVTEGWTSSDVVTTPSVEEFHSSPARHSSGTPPSTASGFTMSDATTLLTKKRRNSCAVVEESSTDVSHQPSPPKRPRRSSRPSLDVQPDPRSWAVIFRVYKQDPKNNPETTFIDVPKDAADGYTRAPLTSIRPIANVTTAKQALELVRQFFKIDMDALNLFEKELQDEEWAAVVETNTGAYVGFGDVEVVSYLK